MFELRIAAIGVAAAGMADWPTAAAVLRGDRAWNDADGGEPKTEALPRTERRRATRVIHLAVAAAAQATSPNEADSDDLPAVFASGEGDMDTFDQICRSLAEPEPWVSPNRFHNSVHNAPSGYWSIATNCRASSTSLSAGDDSVKAGITEALGTLFIDGHERCLLVAYDQAAPPAFREVRPIARPFAAALLLTRSGGGVKLGLTPGGSQTETPCSDPALERLRRSNPAARVLPLLEAIARECHQPVYLGAAPQALTASLQTGQ